ncbi:hypothetical protein Tco_1028029 [Tanacetum coccineum]
MPGNVTGIKINSMVNLSHLFYADDAIFLGQWSELNIDSWDGKNAASNFGCLVLNSIHLMGTRSWGYIQEASWKKKESGQGVINRLSRWKMKLRSIGGHAHIFLSPCLIAQKVGLVILILEMSLLTQVIKAIYGEDGKYEQGWFYSHPMNRGKGETRGSSGPTFLDNSFRRKARSGIEEMQLNSLAEISRMTTLVPCEDRYVWTLESDGVL